MKNTIVDVLAKKGFVFQIKKSWVETKKKSKKFTEKKLNLREKQSHFQLNSWIFNERWLIFFPKKMHFQIRKENFQQELDFQPRKKIFQTKKIIFYLKDKFLRKYRNFEPNGWIFEQRRLNFNQECKTEVFIKKIWFSIKKRLFKKSVEVSTKLTNFELKL